jgi:hypothetical protein
MHHFFQTWQLSFSFSFSFHKLTDVTLSCPFFAIISKPPYCLVIAPSSPLSSDSPIRRRLSGAGSVPRAPWLALLLQLPILHTETWLVSVVLCKAPSFYTEAAILPRFCYIVQGYLSRCALGLGWCSGVCATEVRSEEDILGLSLLLYSFNFPRKSSYSRRRRSRCSRLYFWSSGEKRLKSSPSLGVTLEDWRSL